MTRLRQSILLTTIAGASFGLAFVARSRAPERAVSTTRSGIAPGSPDSLKLWAMGIRPGRQAVVYVLVGSRCGHCQRTDTKAAIRTIRENIQGSTSSRFPSAAVVGVAIDSDLREGLDYLESVGLRSFDEISVGNAWLNEHLVRLVWRKRAAKPAVPQVVIVSRDMAARFRPFNVSYGDDSVLTVISGRTALLEWAAGGAPLSTTDTTRRTVSPSAERTAGVVQTQSRSTAGR